MQNTPSSHCCSNFVLNCLRTLRKMGGRTPNSAKKILCKKTFRKGKKLYLTFSLSEVSVFEIFIIFVDQNVQNIFHLYYLTTSSQDVGSFEMNLWSAGIWNLHNIFLFQMFRILLSCITWQEDIGSILIWNEFASEWCMISSKYF